MKKKCSVVLAGLALALAGASASAQQVIHQSTFDDEGTNGWLVNGNEMLFFGGNPGVYIGLPLMDTWGITLSNDTNAEVLGDMARHGGDIRVSVDVHVLGLYNWWEEPMDPSEFPLVLKLYVAGQEPGNQIGVYFEGEGLPSPEAGWVTYTFTIPASAAGTLPAGWGGLGDETPLGEPTLPPGVTYNDVIANVGEFQLTTFRPGWFYSANFWEIGFDNITFEVVEGGGPECPADWNGDNTVNSSDLSAFITSWLDSVQNGNLIADFNGDSAVNSSDLSAFITAWLSAVQNGC